MAEIWRGKANKARAGERLARQAAHLRHGGRRVMRWRRAIGGELPARRQIAGENDGAGVVCAVGDGKKNR